jgi:hypothetical protein
MLAMNKYKVGEKIRAKKAHFERLAAAFFKETKQKYT